MTQAPVEGELFVTVVHVAHRILLASTTFHLLWTCRRNAHRPSLFFLFVDVGGLVSLFVILYIFSTKFQTRGKDCAK